MKILFVGDHDWANVSNRVARGINAAIGERVARVFTRHTHPLGYEEDWIGVADASKVHDWALDGLDWLISTGDGSYETLIYAREALRPKRWAVAHVGSFYRINPGACNLADAKLGFDKRFIGGDLFRFAVDDPNAVPFFAPPHSVASRLPDLPDRVRIGHSPTTHASKGSATILKVLSRFADRVDVDLIEKVSFEECIARRSRCHIFIDQMNPEIAGYGASAAEAMAWGCATIADYHNVVEDVFRFYEAPPILQVGTADDLQKCLEQLLEPSSRLLSTRAASIAWANKNATPEAVGRYWLEHLE